MHTEGITLFNSKTLAGTQKYLVELAFKRIKERIQGIEIDVLELSPVMITQGGPGCVAIQYILKDNM